jgi:hypothetical protein
VSTKKGKNNVVTMVKEQSKLIQIEEVGTAGAARALPARGKTSLSGADGPKPARLSPEDYVGDSADRTGFRWPRSDRPGNHARRSGPDGRYQKGLIDLEGVQAVQAAMIAHCELMGDRVAILDAPPGLNAQQIASGASTRSATTPSTPRCTGRGSRSLTHSRARACTSRRPVTWPASGHAPTTRAASTRRRPTRSCGARFRWSCSSPRVSTISSTRSAINCIRSFPGRGIRVWGRRTLSSDPAWRYLNVRRLFNYVEESILEGTQWVVFEPNDLNLWQRVKRTINAFLARVWLDGALVRSNAG